MILSYRTRWNRSVSRFALGTLSSASRVRSAAARCSSALVLTFALVCQALLLPAASLAQGPIGVAPNDTNKRYLVYNGQRIALIGVSGEYLPHVPRLRRADGFALIPSQSVKHQESCNYDLIGAVQVLKYKRCIDKLNEAGLNKIRLYVNLNHSPGKQDTQLNPDSTVASQPYDREQSFVWDTGRKRWNLDQLDNNPNDANNYFKRLREVVSYCQDKGVIVEVTLFDPWDPTYASSPWNSANNFAANKPNGIKFTSEVLYAQGDRDFAYDFNLATLIDSNTDNQQMRRYQVAIMKAAVNALVDPTLPPLNNFYWELANESDRTDGVITKQFLNWHYMMAHQLREHEHTRTPNVHHLIGVNFSAPGPIDGLLANSTARQYIDIINGHYVHIGGYGSPFPNLDNPPEPFGAIEILHKYNKYNAGGGSVNNMVWGFNEGHITGIDGDPMDHHAVRAEAWEFMFGGGGVYDHLGFRWANLNNTFNRAVADKTRENLSYLKKVMGESGSLAGMKRSSSWIANPPTYGKPQGGIAGNLYWSAMKNADTFLYYGHRSTHATGSFPRYLPASVSPRVEKLTVQKLGTCRQDYAAEWLRPDNHDATNGAYLPSHTYVKREPFSWSPGETRLLRSPRNYRDFDVAVRVKRTSAPGFCGGASTVPGPNVAAAANGGVASASSTLAGYAPSSVNDGVRTAVNWGSNGGWNDATEGVYPDWVRVDFNGLKTISQINVITLQDNYASGVQPTTDELFTFYGITDYELEYLDDATGTWEPLGGVTGNTNVWRKFTFESVTTRAIRVVVNATMYPSPTSYSRVVEIEAS